MSFLLDGFRIMKRRIPISLVLIVVSFSVTAAVLWFIDAVSLLVYAPAASVFPRAPEYRWLFESVLYSAAFWIPLMLISAGLTWRFTQYLMPLQGLVRTFVITSLVFGLPVGFYTWFAISSSSWALTAGSIVGSFYGIAAAAVAAWYLFRLRPNTPI